MMKKILSIFKSSVFKKLILIIIAASILINIIIGGFFSHVLRKRFQDRSMIGNLEIYSDYMIDDIGIPPDYQKARVLSDKTSLTILIRNDKKRWSSGPVDIDNMYNRARHRKIINKSEIGWGRGVSFLENKRNGYTFTFIKFPPFTDDFHEVHLIILILVITLILVGAYFLVRRVLKPIRELNTGVNEIAKGNLDYRVSSRGKDELAELSTAFNEMADELINMIKARDQLLLDVSHEFRSPLTRMKVAVEMMDDSNFKKSIEDDIVELETMVTEILEEERLREGNYSVEKKPVDIKILLKNITGSYEKNGYHLNYTDSSHEADINGNEIFLTRAIGNIIENAFKYSDHVKDSVEIKLCEIDEYIEITIRDYGPGIPVDEIDFIFEPFYRVDRSRSKKTGGYGLGLSLSKRIVEVHGGSINVKNCDGAGAVFEIRLIKTVS